MKSLNDLRSTNFKIQLTVASLAYSCGTQGLRVKYTKYNINSDVSLDMIDNV